MEVVDPRLERDREVDEVALPAAEDDPLGLAEPAELPPQVEDGAECERSSEARSDRDPSRR
jgi:hypothetical protein